MDERRKAKRTGMDSRLVIKRLDDSKNKEVAINIVDVSKSGIGFECMEPLTFGEHIFLRSGLYRNAGDGLRED